MIEENVLLKDHTTFHIGGLADYFTVVKTVDELLGSIRWAKDKKIPITIIAGGSNILVSDNGIRGLVIKIKIGGISFKEKKDGIEVIAGAGIVFDELVLQTVDKNLWGLENLSGIPGSVGATPIQNVGAYGVEIADHLEWVEVLDIETLKIEKLSSSACEFGYRDSIFKHEKGGKYVVLRVALLLSPKPRPILTYKDLGEVYTDTTTIKTVYDIRKKVLEIRGRKFPDWNKTGTAGSFFKNPVITADHLGKLLQKYPDLPHFAVSGGHEKISLGWILDHVCNMRGYREGNVGTYENQALVFINYGNGTEKEISDLAKKISDEVKKKTNITTAWEVTKLS